MTGPRQVFYVSDGTGITAETIGHSLLTQFVGVEFHTSRLPFVDTPEKAKATAERIREAAERAALNAPIQGSAADIIKVAMIGVEAGLRRAGLASRMLLQVHDELLLEVAPGEHDAVDALVREKMGGAYPLDVPLEVSVGYGPTWDAAAH